MSTSKHILPNTPLSPAEDYALLRAEGLRILQQLAGRQWADYHVHDPGVTILEQLCFALADLGYRLGHPMPDLLTGPDGSFAIPADFRARSILTTQPVTLDDYRRMLLDVDGVRNAWVEMDPAAEPLLSMRWDGRLHIFQSPEPPEEKEPPATAEAEEEGAEEQAPDGIVDDFSDSGELIPAELPVSPAEQEATTTAAAETPETEEPQDAKPAPEEVPPSPALLANRALFVDSIAAIKAVFEQVHTDFLTPGNSEDIPDDIIDKLISDVAEQETRDAVKKIIRETSLKSPLVLPRALPRLFTPAVIDKLAKNPTDSHFDKDLNWRIPRVAADLLLHDLLELLALYTQLYQRKAIRDHLFAYLEEAADPLTYDQLVTEAFAFIERQAVPHAQGIEDTERLRQHHQRVVKGMQELFRAQFMQYAPDTEKLTNEAVAFLLQDLAELWAYYDLEDAQWPLRQHLLSQLKGQPKMAYPALADEAFEYIKGYQKRIEAPKPGVGIKGLLRIKIEPEFRRPERDNRGPLELYKHQMKAQYLDSTAYGSPYLSYDKAMAILDDFARFWPGYPNLSESYEAVQNIPNLELEEIPTEELIEYLFEDAADLLAHNPEKAEEVIQVHSFEEIIHLEVLQELENVLLEARGLGIDFSSIDILQAQPVEVRAEVEVAPHASPADVLVAIYDRIDHYLSPKAPFYTLPQMLAKGYALEDIVQGPRLRSGYLDPEELAHFEKRTYVHTSEIVELIADIPGVHMVQSIGLATYDAEGERIEDDWAIQVAPHHFPILAMPEDDALIRLKRGEFRLSHRGFREKWEQRNRQDAKPYPALHELDHIPEPGQHREPAQYDSLEHFLPRIYGVAADSLPRSADDYRRALAKQLQAYLLFFDQILANGFAQLGGVHQMLSFRQTVGVIKTQFHQDLADVTSRGHLLNGQLAQVGETRGKNNRRQMLMNYLLAAFNEQLPAYELLRIDQSDDDYENYLSAKVQLLGQYPALSHARPSGMDFRKADSLSAFRQRIMLLLSHLTKEEGEADDFWIVEHILLRPLPADVAQFERNQPPGGLSVNPKPVFLHQPVVFDPFQLQLSIVFQKAGRYADDEFWAFVEGLLRTELPAHLQLYAFHLEPEEYTAFKTAYHEWRNALAEFGRPLDTNLREKALHLWHLREARNGLIDKLDTYGGPFGQTYPILDLPAEAPINYVKEGGQVAVHITLPHSQPGALYQLYDRAAKKLSGEQFVGTGGPLTLISDKIDAPADVEVQSFQQNFDIKVLKPLPVEPAGATEGQPAEDTTEADPPATAVVAPPAAGPEKTGEESTEQLPEGEPIALPAGSTPEYLEGWMQTEVAVDVKVLQLHQDIDLINPNEESQYIWPELAGQNAILRIRDPEPEVHYRIYMYPLDYNDMRYSKAAPADITQGGPYRMGAKDKVEGEGDLSYWIDPVVLEQPVSEGKWQAMELGGMVTQPQPHLDIEIPLEEYYKDCLIRVEASFEENGATQISDFMHQQTHLFAGPRTNVHPQLFGDTLVVEAPQAEVQYSLYYNPGDAAPSSWVLLGAQALHQPKEIATGGEAMATPNEGLFRIGVDMVLSQPIAPGEPVEGRSLVFDYGNRLNDLGIKDIKTGALRLVARKMTTGLSVMIDILGS